MSCKVTAQLGGKERREATVVASTGLSESPTAISIRDLGKSYRLWENPKDRLKQPLRSMLARWLPIAPRNYFKEFWALHNISFDVTKGETVGIIGKNGSGKSTLLQIVSGTLTPTCGTVETAGRIAALLELGSGFHPEFTGRENVYMNAAIWGLTREEVSENYEAIVQFADIGAFIDQPVKTYSSGMYVRLAFAVAAHVNADILVIDEALAVGDAFFGQKCMRYLRKFRERGTVLFVSHDTGAVVNLCQRAVLLENGGVRAIGPAKEVCELYHEALYSSRQDTAGVADKVTTRSTDAKPEEGGSVDQRLKYINQSKYRNDIELFTFNKDSAAFGDGRAFVVDVSFLDASTGAPLQWIVGGERVSLRIRCRSDKDLEGPLVGFLIKDRLGQALFGDNTYLTYRGHRLTVPEGTFFEAAFTFRMPILPVGDYSVTVALAEGTQEEHVQHHWIHDALFFKSHSSSVCTGLVGVPMEAIWLKILEDQG